MSSLNSPVVFADPQAKGIICQAYAVDLTATPDTTGVAILSSIKSGALVCDIEPGVFKKSRDHRPNSFDLKLLATVLRKLR